MSGAGQRRDPGRTARSGPRPRELQRPPRGAAPGRHRQVCARSRRAAEGKWVTAGPSAPGTGRAGPDLRAPARAGRLPRPGAAPPARLASCPAPRPARSLRPRRVLPRRAAASDPGESGPGAEPDAGSAVPAAAGAMGTPASVVSDPPGRAAPAARGRKRGSANIFQGVGLPELRSLFQTGGAERPEERARLVWRYGGQRRMARALRRLRRRQPAQPGGGMARTLRRFGRLR
ncbi:arginine vasopressin-induced protein 1 isoform X2 [Strigops habroptila]|nr:arginine vasopressin-induced protein 1 isoform X2 [Strigops habroptila]